jgi:pimeloyl-ACP methyl ester carboxylesterase
VPLLVAGELDDIELFALVSLLIAAGHETTTSLIGGGVRLLLERPDLADELCARLERVADFVEELVRWDPPLQWTVRRTTREVEVGEAIVPAGAKVQLLLGAANRDRSASRIPAGSTSTATAAATSASGWAATTAWVRHWLVSRVRSPSSSCSRTSSGCARTPPGRRATVPIRPAREDWSHTASSSMADKVLRTPDGRFDDLPDWPFAPRYADVVGGELGPLRMAFVDEGARDAPVAVLLHGEPTWSYLYRHVIPPLVDAGLRVVAPDLIGFGRSDKPRQRKAHSYAAHQRWLETLLFDHLDLRDVVLLCQDWGGLLGLRLVGLHPERFAAVVASNTALPTGEEALPEEFSAWLAFSQEARDFPIGDLVQLGTCRDLTPGRGRGLRRALPERGAQGRTASAARARAHDRRRPGSHRQPVRVGGPRAVRARLRLPVRRPRSRHPRRRPAAHPENPGRPGPVARHVGRHRPLQPGGRARRAR